MLGNWKSEIGNWKLEMIRAAYVYSQSGLLHISSLSEPAFTTKLVKQGRRVAGFVSLLREDDLYIHCLINEHDDNEYRRFRDVTEACYYLSKFL